MEHFSSMLEGLKAFLYLPLFPSLIVLSIYAKLNPRFDLPFLIKIVRGLLLFLFVFQVIVFGTQFFSEEWVLSFKIRTTGYYAYPYMFMLVANFILPLLLFSQLGKRLWFLITLSLLMNSGVFFARLVILSTSFHRDLDTGDYVSEVKLFLLFEVIKVVVISFVFIAIDSVRSKNKPTETHMEEVL